MQEPTEAEIAALKDNLSTYKSKAQEYESQIHHIQDQIKAITVVPAGSEKHAIRELISRELEDLRVLLLTLSPDAQLPGLSPYEQNYEQLQLAVHRWLELTKGSLHRLFQMKLRLQQLLFTGLTRLQTSQRVLGRAEIVAGDDMLQRLLSEYAALVEETYAVATAAKEPPGLAALTEKIAKEEVLTESLITQTTELSAILERLRSDVAKKQLQLQTSKEWETETNAAIDATAIELKRLKNELVLSKEKIRDLGLENDELEKALTDTTDPLSEEEMQLRVEGLRASAIELEARRQALQTEVFDLHNQLGLDEDTIANLEEQLMKRESIEDVGEKMSSVQEKLRDLMVSLESVSSEEDYSPRTLGSPRAAFF